MQLNQGLIHVDPGEDICGCKWVHIRAELNRYIRFMPFLEQAFPETATSKGIIESDLLNGDITREYLNSKDIYPERVYIKDDRHLPVAGGLEAREGISKVLRVTEQLSQKEKLLMPTEDYSGFCGERAREILGQYALEIPESEPWAEGARKVAKALEFETVSQGDLYTAQRDNSLGGKSPEDSSEEVSQGSVVDLGQNSVADIAAVAVAALRLKVQLHNKDVEVNDEHQLFVYITRPVGTAVAGLAFGLKEVYGDLVHVFCQEAEYGDPEPEGLTSELVDQLLDGRYSCDNEETLVPAETGIMEVMNCLEYIRISEKATHILWDA